ncbi:recombinase family protein [Photorhabdus africana]|uniref:recombinase family protein n=1 Tax=Photorhabdus africana TaxID=3097554 RepID=UPI003F6B6577
MVGASIGFGEHSNLTTVQQRSLAGYRVLIFSALAEFERNLIKERTQSGLAAARDRKGAETCLE